MGRRVVVVDGGGGGMGTELLVGKGVRDKRAAATAKASVRHEAACLARGP